jgi:dienelactone hydrolase
MGVVYRATDTRLDRTVAIKMLPSEATADPDRNRRFVQEARAASALNHPHIVTIHEIDEKDGTTFIAMELVEGTPLDKLIAQKPLPIATVFEYGAQIGSALSAAHESGIVHRDIKPANILITPDGRAKVLDFGLAKLVERDPSKETMTGLVTRSGVIMGTPAYMSPEQAEGRPVSASSDVFSFGAVLYEMLSGKRPFAGNSDLGLVTAILRDQPPPLRSVRADVPAALQTIVERCLAKDPAARYGTARALKADIDAARRKLLSHSTDARWRRPAVLVMLGAILLAGAGLGTWQVVEARRVRWAQQEALPEIERLQVSDRTLDAVRLAGQADRYAPEAVQRLRQTWYRFNFDTDPAGASVEIRNYLDLNGKWEPIGQTPVSDTLLPFGYYRLRAAKTGFEPVDITTSTPQRRSIRLMPAGTAPGGMVAVMGGRDYAIGVAEPVALPDFWIDKLEVTNRAFKAFVDAGGYRDSQYWQEPFREGARELAFAEAIARFRDSTGRTGPSTWELGSFPEGQADFPVGGISWFEAAAFARFAGKSLPTVYHWYRTSNPDDLFADILRLSNIDGKGLAKAGERQGFGPWGTLDMAGNVKEWCANAVDGSSLRYILGGSWSEPSYRYYEPDARNPWDRLPTFGVRLVKSVGLSPKEAEAPIAQIYGDPKSVVPVADAQFEIYRRFYAYDRSALDARVEQIDDSSPHWRKETVSFAAAYGSERIPAHLFLPRNARPPFQTVVLFPSGYATNAGSSQYLDYFRFDFIIRSGRALLYPVYQGTYERRVRRGGGPNALRDLYVQRAKDFFRAVDYLETRAEIDKARLAYYSLSMGAYFGPIPVALEPRVKAAVFVAAGLRFNFPPEIHPANFAPRVKVPVLVINGRDDFQNPIASQRRFVELLGTPPDQKELVMLDGGHVPNDTRGTITRVLDWYDRHLGPVPLK